MHCTSMEIGSSGGSCGGCGSGGGGGKEPFVNAAVRPITVL